MTVARLKACIESLRGDVITNTQVLRIGVNLYALTSDAPDPTLTNDQKAGIVLGYLRNHCRAFVRDGAELLKKQTEQQSDIDDIMLAASTAVGDV